jgi:hypothetical protein
MVRVGELRKRKIKEADKKLNLVEEESFFETILEKKIFLTIASGATTIGSAGRAPDDIIESHCDLKI